MFENYPEHWYVYALLFARIAASCGETFQPSYRRKSVRPGSLQPVRFT